MQGDLTVYNETLELADRFAAEYLGGATSKQVPLYCQTCGVLVAHVHPPAPSVALTCSKCREVTP
ncbi:hypothetical protein [Rhodococcoides fascians]|uniref:hypothetical protein n=1 Tax=Rhodococcoides fascians TaxID=1828 RepID=UPI000A589ACD|nr:hypothetical protein [Rhodococcus fascians]